MEASARVLIFAGVTIVLAGVLLLAASRVGLGRLPGDIVVEREHARLYVPIVTSIVLSLLLTLVLNVALRLWR
jgi:hypothetical protein